ncbi:MAG: hypothetical protein RMK00_07410, partial [Bacteroidota bacterium]|nr:hypothetical protein [Bacteroidota bacterium]
PREPIGCLPQGNGVQVGGVLIPQFIALPVRGMKLHPKEPEGPVCGLPPLDIGWGVIQYAWIGLSDGGVWDLETGELVMFNN